MTTKQSISVKQFKVLVIFFMVGDLMWFLPSLVVRIARQDAWLSTLAGIVLGMGAAALIYWFSLKFPGMTLIHIHRKVLGRLIGGLLSLLFLTHALSNASAQLRAIGDFMTSQMMSETPLRAVTLLFGLTVVLTVKAGLPVIARTGQIFLMVFILLITALALLLLPEVETQNLLPVMDAPFGDIMKGGLYITAFPFCQLVVFLMLFPYVDKKELKLWSFMQPIIMGSIVTIVIVLLSIAVLGVYMTEHQLYSTYIMAKKINIGNFLQRLEAILVISYLLSTYFKCTITVFALCLGMEQLFGLKDRPGIAAAAVSGDVRLLLCDLAQRYFP